MPSFFQEGWQIRPLVGRAQLAWLQPPPTLHVASSMPSVHSQLSWSHHHLLHSWLHTPSACGAGHQHSASLLFEWKSVAQSNCDRRALFRNMHCGAILRLYVRSWHHSPANATPLSMQFSLGVDGCWSLASPWTQQGAKGQWIQPSPGFLCQRGQPDSAILFFFDFLGTSAQPVRRILLVLAVVLMEVSVSR